VVALGNNLMGDDGFGPAVLARLRQDARVTTATDLLDAHTDLLGHLERFAGRERVILIDVVLDPDPGTEPGVVVLQEDLFASWPQASPSCHQLTPVLAVKLFRALHPDARCQISLVALRTDGVQTDRLCLTEEAIQQGAKLVRGLLKTAGPEGG